MNAIHLQSCVDVVYYRGSLEAKPNPFPRLWHPWGLERRPCYAVYIRLVYSARLTKAIVNRLSGSAMVQRPSCNANESITFSESLDSCNRPFSYNRLRQNESLDTLTDNFTKRAHVEHSLTEFFMEPQLITSHQPIQTQVIKLAEEHEKLSRESCGKHFD